MGKIEDFFGSSVVRWFGGSEDSCALRVVRHKRAAQCTRSIGVRGQVAIFIILAIVIVVG